MSKKACPFLFDFILPTRNKSALSGGKMCFYDFLKILRGNRNKKSGNVKNFQIEFFVSKGQKNYNMGVHRKFLKIINVKQNGDCLYFLKPL